MLNGYTEALEELLKEFSEHGDVMPRKYVLEGITKAVAAEDCWQVPVDPMEEGENETDYADGLVPEKLPHFVKKTLNVNGEGRYFCAFTRAEKVAGEEEEPLMSLRYPAKELLREFLDCEESDGFVLNPWSESFRFTREEAREALAAAETFTRQEVLATHSYSIAPRGVIDTNEILKSWQGEWTDREKREENWRLRTYPIMPDGKILLLFEMRDELDGTDVEDYEEERSFCHYRVLEYEVGNDGPVLRNRYRFRAQDTDLGTVLLHEGKLRAVLSDSWTSRYRVQPVFPDEGESFNVHSNIQTVTMTGAGETVVAYKDNLRDRARMPLMVYDSEGKVAWSYRDEYVLYCQDVNLDSEEHLWFLTYPNTGLKELSADRKTLTNHRVEMGDFVDMALSDDRSLLFANYTERNGGGLQYVLHRNGDGDYVDPIRFDFRPTDAEGNELEVEKCSVWGRCSSMKSWVILNADGRLYLYDINDLLEAPLSAEDAPETGRSRLPQKLRKLLEAWKTKKEGCREHFDKNGWPAKNVSIDFRLGWGTYSITPDSIGLDKGEPWDQGFLESLQGEIGEDLKKLGATDIVFYGDLD